MSKKHQKITDTEVRNMKRCAIAFFPIEDVRKKVSTAKEDETFVLTGLPEGTTLRHVALIDGEGRMVCVNKEDRKKAGHLEPARIGFKFHNLKFESVPEAAHYPSIDVEIEAGKEGLSCDAELRYLFPHDPVSP